MPLLNHKILGQARSVTSNGEVTLYTVPANTTVEVKTINLTHAAATNTAGTFTFTVSKNGAATGTADYLSYTEALKGSERLTIPVNLSLSAGDVIRFSASHDDLIAQAYGTEIYTPTPAVSFDVYENGVVTTIRLYGLENNLNYLKYADENDMLRIGFRGYGPLSEIKLNFGSPLERDSFVSALEQARLYGNPFTFDPVYPIVYIGNNISTDSTTTTTTIAPTSTTTTTSTTIAPGSTTTTTIAPTSSTTTTTTTIAPTQASISWIFEVVGYVDEVKFRVNISDDNEIYYEDAAYVYTKERGTTQGTINPTYLVSPNLYADISVTVPTTSNGTRIEIWDVTDPANPILADTSNEQMILTQPGYYTFGSVSISQEIELGKAYEIRAKCT